MAEEQKDVEVVSLEARTSQDSEIEEEPSAKPVENAKKIEKKAVKDLTAEEREIIIANAKNGVENEHFDVKFLKNGNSRIVAKKSKAPTISQKVIKNNNDGKVYLSNDQLLMEHIMELNSRLDKLSVKHKKLKKKYRHLKNDIYEDVNESLDITPLAAESSVSEPLNETLNENQKNEEQKNEEQTDKEQNIIYRSSVSRGWRSKVQYL